MSTFDGLVEEFPDIRIDYFRNHPNRRQPAACFLSHVHSDHLLGLETLKMPFVYCSAATRRLLLKMEKYPHRINFSKGILEARKQTYKHLKLILRPLPLRTSVDIELRPNYHIRVTLFDANHCPGAVMFLIEGDGRAVLYTGDIRAEPWWVNSIVRHPTLIPYTSGQKSLDCLYLDTTFASHRDIYREFPTKAEGLAELLKKLSKCSADSMFYFRAWTLGYEDVWIAMSSFLNSRVHVDRYQLQLFQAVNQDGLASEPGLALAGFRVGNSDQPGCLTTDAEVKIHSCEPGMPCHAGISKNKQVVWITPIISRTSDGTEIAEVGAGGGKGDSYQCRELDISNDTMFEALKLLVSTLTDNQDAATRLEKLMQTVRSHQDHRIIFDSLGTDAESELSLKDFVKIVVADDKTTLTPATATEPKALQQTSNTIHFPYSRHSSYSELCHLVEAFRPKDICPCTVDLSSWTEDVSIESLFGQLCSSATFRYDKIIREEVEKRHKDSAETADKPETQQLDTQQTETQTASQSSNDVFTSFHERAAAQCVVIEDDSVTPIPRAQDRIFTEFSKAWRNVNGDEHKYSNGLIADKVRPIECGTSSEAMEVDGIAEETEQDRQDPEDNFDCTDGLSDLEGSLIRLRKRVRITGDGTVFNVDGADDMPDSLLSGESDNIDFERRMEAYRAAVLCLKHGDNSLWGTLDISSFRNYHQTSSPEL